MNSMPSSPQVVRLPAVSITEGPVPKHAQLRAILEDLCDSSLRPGDLLPGERVLEETYGVSRITVRRAIGDLVASGRLQRARGRGTFVGPQPLVARPSLASFSSEMATRNVSATSRTLLAGSCAAPSVVSAFFGGDADVAHTRLRRLRLGDGQPYSIDDGWYNATLLPGLLDHDIRHSVYSVLEHGYGLPVTTADQEITAVAADEEQASLLDVPPGAPLLRVVRLSRSGDLPVEWCSSVYRTDRYHLNTRVTRPEE